MGLLALTTCEYFALGQASSNVRALVLGFVCVVTTGIAFVGWRKSPQGSLRWDGQHWHWSGFTADPACQLVLLMDFQSVVVVLLKSESHAPVGLCLEATPDDTSWRALRRAIVSSQIASDSKSKKPGLAAEGDLA
jgi:hypothetical protein